jgi:hypothetical protein
VSERAVVIIAEDESSAGTSSGDLASDTLRPPTAGVRSGIRPLHGNNTIPGELHLGGDGESFPVDDRPKKKENRCRGGVGSAAMFVLLSLEMRYLTGCSCCRCIKRFVKDTWSE